MENRNSSRIMSFGTSELALEVVMEYIDDHHDRGAISQVCRKWYHIDSITRKHLTIALCYSTTPERVRSRFPGLSHNLKGRPRAAMFTNLIPEVGEGTRAEAFTCLKSIHFRRMMVHDAEIEVLVRARGHMLVSLKLNNCSGFLPIPVKLIARSCRSIHTGVGTLKKKWKTPSRWSLCFCGHLKLMGRLKLLLGCLIFRALRGEGCTSFLFLFLAARNS